MKHELPVANHVISLISELQNAGFEAYIVGGAIRDLLLGRTPKDYDISTSVASSAAASPGSSGSGSASSTCSTAANSLK